MAMSRKGAFLALWRAFGKRRPGDPSAMALLSVAPRMLKAAMSREYKGLSATKLALMGVAVVYMVSPVDFMPELLLNAFGLTDDAVAAAWLAGMVLDEAGAYKRWEDEKLKGDSNTLTGETVDSD